MVDTHVFRWSAGSLVEDEWCDPHAGVVRVADSFLVIDGTTIAIDDHLTRFTRSVNAVAPDRDTEEFARDAIGAIPREGRWFPRLETIEYGEGVMFRVHIRPAPEPSTEVTLATSTHDPRTDTSTKGPDLVALGALRREFDCGEAIILDGGVIAEGAWSSIAWWTNDTLHVVDSSVPRLGGITEGVVRRHATAIGAPVVEARATPEDLEGAEVWVLSALHGIRVATDWRDGPDLHIEPGRADYWRQQYINHRTVLSTP